MTIDSPAVVIAMKEHGGSFVRALAMAYYMADVANQEKLKAAFPEYWQKYLEIARADRATRNLADAARLNDMKDRGI